MAQSRAAVSVPVWRPEMIFSRRSSFCKVQIPEEPSVDKAKVDRFPSISVPYDRMGRKWQARFFRVKSVRLTLSYD
jgi:hypothetical protein